MPTRKLSIIPIIHTDADLGRLAQSVREQLAAEAGEQALADRDRAVDAIWNMIERWADSIDAKTAHVYQDGLPASPHAADIVRELAGTGSRNHVLLQKLATGGATIEGPEDPQLLIKEYEALKAQIEGREPEHDSAAILDDRDHFIAKTIDATLALGEHGVLFIGALHDVERFLPDTITVTRPIDLTDRASEETAA